MKLIIKKNNLINPQNAVLLIPILIGLLITIIYSIFITKYTFEEKNSKRQQLNESERMKKELPMIKIKKEKLQYLLNQERKKKLFIIDLVGGTKYLSTFLVSLNNIANKNSLEIIEIEPKEIKVLTKADPNNVIQNNQVIRKSATISNINSGNVALQGSDPKDKSLLTPELEEHKLSLKIQGNYIEILEFIKELELLENIVISKNIQMERLSSQFVDNNNAKLFIDISVYSKINEQL